MFLMFPGSVPHVFWACIPSKGLRLRNCLQYSPDFSLERACILVPMSDACKPAISTSEKVPRPFRARSRAFPLFSSHQSRPSKAFAQVQHLRLRCRTDRLPRRAQSAVGSIVAPWSRCEPSARRRGRPNYKSANGSKPTRSDGEVLGTVMQCSKRRRRIVARGLSLSAMNMPDSCGNRACTVARRNILASTACEMMSTTRAKMLYRAARRVIS